MPCRTVLQKKFFVCSEEVAFQKKKILVGENNFVKLFLVEVMVFEIDGYCMLVSLRRNGGLAFPYLDVAFLSLPLDLLAQHGKNMAQFIQN